MLKTTDSVLLGEVCTALYRHRHGTHGTEARVNEILTAIRHCEPSLRRMATNEPVRLGEASLQALAYSQKALGTLFNSTPTFMAISQQRAGTVGDTFDVSLVRRDYGLTMLEMLRGRFPAGKVREQQPVARVLRETIGVVRGSRKTPINFGPYVPLGLASLATDSMIAPMVYLLGDLIENDERHIDRTSHAELLNIIADSHHVIPIALKKNDDSTWIALTA